MTEAEQRSAVVAEARTWLGTAYHSGARVKGAGVDCAQILIAVYSALGLIDDFDPGYYAPDFMMHRGEERYLGWVEKYARKVETPQPGDIALFKFGRCISHGAIVIAWPTIIHAFIREGGVCLSDGTQGDLTGRLAGFYSVWSA